MDYKLNYVPANNLLGNPNVDCWREHWGLHTKMWKNFQKTFLLRGFSRVVSGFLKTLFRLRLASNSLNHQEMANNSVEEIAEEGENERVLAIHVHRSP